MASIKLKLTADPVFDDFFKETYILGIISPQKQYQLCWQINKQLNFNFRLNSELEALIRKKEKHCFFQIYEYKEPLRFTTHYFYSNHYKGEYLLPELKHFDFIWILKGTYYSEKDVELLTNDIRSLNTIQMVTRLQASSLKNKVNLVI